MAKAALTWATVLFGVLGLVCTVLAGPVSARPASRPLSQPASAPGQPMRQYEGKYYLIRTDLDMRVVREAEARLNAMAEEYYRRTISFGGVIRRKMPLYLFSRLEDFHAAGAPAASVGLFTGKALAAVYLQDNPSRTWRVVQHEAWHQFARIVVSHRLPMWVDEGLAEYYGHGLWTGDGFLSGLVPQWRLERLKGLIRTNALRPFSEMLAVDREDWNAALNLRDYDQAWAMMHFLVHADGGRYAEPTGGFVVDIATGRPWRIAFANRFGGDAAGFQRRFEQWWLGQDSTPTADLYDRAAVATLTSFLGRAHAQGQLIASAEEFFELAQGGLLKMSQRQWLPPGLLMSAVKDARESGNWSLEHEGTKVRLKLVRPDGTKFTGSFRLSDSLVSDVKVEVARQEATPPTTQASAAPGGADLSEPDKLEN